MATLISDFNDAKKYKSYGSACLDGKSIRSTCVPFLIIAKGNVFEGIEAKE